VRKHSFDSNPEIYHDFSPFYPLITALIRKRKERSKEMEIGPVMMQKIHWLLEESALKKYAKEYPEFDSLYHILSHIRENIHKDTSDVEQELIDETEEISKPHLKSIISTDPSLVHTYNVLVELYDLFEVKLDSVKGIDEELFSGERKVVDQVKVLSKQTKDIVVIQKSKAFAQVYNNIVMLFNHYTRKQQLKKALEGV
jgi:hypothetical protein